MSLLQNDGNSYTFALAREAQAIMALVLSGAAFDGLVMPPPVVETLANTVQSVGFVTARSTEIGQDPFAGMGLPDVPRQGNIIRRGS